MIRTNTEQNFYLMTYRADGTNVEHSDRLIVQDFESLDEAIKVADSLIPLITEKIRINRWYADGFRSPDSFLLTMTA